MAYLSFYHLKEEPFSNAPLKHFFFENEEHNRALTRLLHAAAAMKGLAILVGEVGSGKTTLARRILDELSEAEYIASLLVIVHPNVTRDWLLRKVAIQLGVEHPYEDKVPLMGQLFERLVHIQQEKKKAVVIIDEAQMLRDKEIFEEIRGMLNLETGEGKLITFIMFGLPELESAVYADQPLAQRVSMRLTLRPFDDVTTRSYIVYRMTVAGSAQHPFTEEALDAIYHYTKGIPRLINNICDNALLEGYLRKMSNIDLDLIREIALDLRLTESEQAQITQAAPSFTPAVVRPSPASTPAIAAAPYRLDFSVLAEDEPSKERADLDQIIHSLESKR
ncbi:MAG: AAA family ATPase [Nitrospirae bacterium]|nr:AAA family ATPase [Nitrospirota bacterium]